MPNDPTPITGVITTTTAATGTAVEPSLTLTQLHALLRDAAAYERAKRPLVIHQAANPDTTTAPAGHPGIDVTIPAPGAALVPAPLRRPARAGGWGVRAVYASMAALLTGAADGVLAGTAPLPVALCAAGILGAIGGTARALTEQERQARS